jgi:SAM-dependent methyltransferase
MGEPAKSITHQHLLSIVNTEWRRREDRAALRLRLLDVGCGDGALLAYLAQQLPALNPEIQLELYGFDVHDHGVQPPGFLVRAAAALTARLPSVPWTERLASVAAGDPWPYPDGFFDAIVSNQVLEHVADHDRLFAETYRTLRPGGYAAHLFPLKHYLFEGHLRLPLAHRLAGYELLRGDITWSSRLGLGKYPAHRRSSGVSLAEYAERHADYLYHFTNYLSYRAVLALGKKHHLRASCRYTREFYTSKLRALLGLSPVYVYPQRRSALADRTALFFCQFVSSVTLFLSKRQTY